MRAALVAAAAACLLVAALAAEAPATLVDGRLDALSGGRVRVADASGTVWNGSGALVLQPSGARVPVLWHIDALPLLRGRLAGTLGRDTAAIPRGSFDLGSDDFAVRSFELASPAEALLRTSGAPSIIAAAGGIVAVRGDSFALRRGAFDGGFVVRWQDASVPGLRPDIRFALGDVRLDATATGGEIRSTLSNLGGDVELSGTMTLGANGAARIDVRLKPRPEIDKERLKAFSSAMAMVGAADDSGGFRLSWQVPAR